MFHLRREQLSVVNKLYIMPNLYIASTATYEDLKSLYQGFLIELDGDGNPILLIKLEPALLVSIINGCLLEVVIRNPNLLQRSCTLYVYDNINDPFFVVAGNFGNEDPVMKGFDEILIKMALESQRITIALYNELSHPVFSTNLQLKSDREEFHKWLNKVYNYAEYRDMKNDFEGHFYPENAQKGFPLKIINVNNSSEVKLEIIAPEYGEEWRQNQSSTFGHFSYDDYKGDGKHGNYQELAITNHFCRFFQLDIDFFISPKKADNTEFCDYVMIDHNAAIVIESKYILSQKTTKRHAAITKAIGQLNKTEVDIIRRNLNLQNKPLESRLMQVDVIIKLCLLNDRIYLTTENSKTIVARYQKRELPLFMSSMKFFELATALTLKNKMWVVPNLFYNLIKIYKEYLEGDKEILHLTHFNVEGLSIDELNKMGNRPTD